MKGSIEMPQTFWHILARTWAAIAFFHPLVQERGRDWEDALVSILPQAEFVVDEPLISANQRAVLETLLASLNDNATQLTAEPVDREEIRPTITRETLSGNVAYIRVCNWFNFRIAPGYLSEWEDAIHSLNAAIEGATRDAVSGLILDFRETRGDLPEEDSEARFINGRLRFELVARLFTEPIALPALARIQRVGYHSPITLGGYATEWVIQAGIAPVQPVADAFSGPTVVLTSRDTCSLLEPVLILLQRTRRAICIGEQSFAYHTENQTLHLTDDLSLQLRRYALIYHDRPARYIPDVQADDPLATALALLTDPIHQLSEARSSNQPLVAVEAYREELPSRPQRIMAVIKLWTAMRTFYAYRDHLTNWDAALVPAIHEVATATTREQYFAALQRLSSSCKGGHNFVLFTCGKELLHASCPNGFAPGIRLVRVGDEITVIGPVEPNVPVQPGDVLLCAIDEEPVHTREERLRSLFNQYPADAIDHYLLQALLDSPEGAHLKIRLRDAQGTSREIELVADHPVSFVTEPVAVTALPAWGMLSNEFDHIGYLDASRVTIEHIDKALDELSSAEAIIVDLRRYPTMPPLSGLQRFRRYPLQMLTQLRPVVVDPEGGIFGWQESLIYGTDILPPVDTPDERPLAALIGGGQVSMGEDWTYQIRIGCGALLVGSVTAGGVGSNAFVSLPGSGRASFSGACIPKAALQQPIEGNGINPDIEVHPVPGDDRDHAVIVAANALLQKLPDNRSPKKPVGGQPA